VPKVVKIAVVRDLCKLGKHQALSYNSERWLRKVREALSYNSIKHHFKESAAEEKREKLPERRQP